MDARDVILRLVACGGIAALGGYITTLITTANPQVSRMLQMGVGVASLLLMGRVMQLV